MLARCLNIRCSDVQTVICGNVLLVRNIRCNMHAAIAVVNIALLHMLDHKVGRTAVALVPASVVAAERPPGDLYSHAKNVFVAHHGGVKAWLVSKLRADMIRAMSPAERKRRRLPDDHPLVRTD